MDDLLPLELASLKTLIPPDVPGVDDYFDVNVTLAASPSNFTVGTYIPRVFTQFNQYL